MFKFKFAAVVRTDKKSHIHHLSTIASSERKLVASSPAGLSWYCLPVFRCARWLHESGKNGHCWPAGIVG
ncbi:host cell division inhibitor Icd-like protein [Escherichia coli]